MGRELGVIPAISVDVSILDLSNLTHPGSRNQAPESLIFITDVNRFLERSMHDASCVSQINSINAIEFGLRDKCGPDRFELCRVQDEPGVEPRRALTAFIGCVENKIRLRSLTIPRLKKANNQYGTRRR